MRGEIHHHEEILCFWGVNSDHSSIHRGIEEGGDTGRTLVFFYLSICLTKMRDRDRKLQGRQ